MSIEKKNKDHQRAHGGVSQIPPEPPESDDPLRFWTSHPTERVLVDLHPFADGQLQSANPLGVTVGNWGGPYTGRPALIAELAPAIRARCILVGEGRALSYLHALRDWWRLFDAIESDPVSTGQLIPQVSSVVHLSALHEAVAKQRNMAAYNFRSFLSIADDTRTLLRLPKLGWIPPSRRTGESHLIPEHQARAFRTVLKQDWERVLRTWARNDRVMAEADRRAAGEAPTDLGEDARLLKNWQHFQVIQQETGRTLPSGDQLLGNWTKNTISAIHGLERRMMRAIQFPTVEEADIAFHLALMNSGWNPSTLAKVDADDPYLTRDHPKNVGQLVLSIAASGDAAEEEFLKADKARAGGRTQFCIGQKSQRSSAPMVVAAYLKRAAPLRALVTADCKTAEQELVHLQSSGARQEAIAAQFKRVQTLKRWLRSVWLYVDNRGNIGCLNINAWKRYPNPEGGKGIASYLDVVRRRLNAQRPAGDQIPNVTPADFRHIYARWVYLQSKGNILAVMLALGHASLETTRGYLRHKIYKVEHDDQIRRFMAHLFDGLGRGEIDLTKLAQLVRHGEITPEMEARLAEYRTMQRSRIGVGCANPRHPPTHVAPGHVLGRLCGSNRCLKQCEHARFLPEAMDGIAMRVEELMVMSDHLPREPWLKGGFQEELEMGEDLLESLFQSVAVADARAVWRARILAGGHLIPGLGRIDLLEEAA